jgi:hypothetical protein
MEILPQIQSTTSSRNMSLKGAQGILKDFLETQKKFFNEHETTDIDNNENTEEVFNMDDKDDKLGYEEFQQRIESMIDSLSDDYFTRKREKVEIEVKIETSGVEPQDASVVDSTDSDAMEDTAEEEGIKKETSDQISKDDKKEELEIISTSPGKDSKKLTKEQKRELKEKKKALKSDAKQARKEEKERQKALKKAEKEKQKKIKKEKKGKRKREESEGGSSTKRSKI